MSRSIEVSSTGDDVGTAVNSSFPLAWLLLPDLSHGPFLPTHPALFPYCNFPDQKPEGANSDALHSRIYKAFS